MKTLTTLLTIAFGVLILLFVTRGMAEPGHDFLQYWASARLLLQHENPYSKPLVTEVETAAGSGNGAATLVTPNPPYFLPVALPLGFFSRPQTAGTVWVLLLAACVAVSIRSQWLAYLYPPVFACLLGGQSAPLQLLGVALFLRFHRKKPWAAGLGLLLLAFKPHLFVPFGIVLLWWIAARKVWPVLWTPVCGLILLSAAVTAFRPEVWADYLRMGTTNGMQNWFIPCLGGWLRRTLYQPWVWLQFLPLAIGCIWAAFYFRSRRKEWDWNTHGALLLMVSLAVSPYEWFTDEIAILPVILAGVRTGRSILVPVLISAIAGAELVAGILPGTGFYTWTIVAWIAWWLSTPVSASARLPEAIQHGRTA